MFLIRSPAARRRRRKDREVDAEERIFGPRYIINKARRSRAASRLFGINTVNKNYQIYDTLKATSSANSSFPSNVPDLDAMDIPVDVEEIVPKSAVSVTRIAKIKSANETEDLQAKSSNDRNNSTIVSNTSHSRVPSVRVQKVSKQDIIDEVQTKPTDINYQESTANVSITSKTNSTRINVTKIPRNKTVVTKQNSLSNMNNETGKITEKSSVEMRSMRRRSKTASHVTDTRPKPIDGVIVKKIPRTPTSAPSHHS